MFTARQLKIIELIAGNVGGIYNNKIAEALHVSSRTIRNEIQAINAIWGPTCKIASSNQYGYYFADEDLNFVRNFLYQSKEIYLSEEKDRRYLLLGMLLHAKETDVYELGEQLYLSPQSIIRELSKLREVLKTEYQVTPITVKSDRIYFSMEEEMVRRLLFRITKNEIGRQESNNRPFSLKELLSLDYDQDEFTALTKQIDAFFHAKNVDLNDDYLIMISSAIYIVQIRNSNDCLIEVEQAYKKDTLLDQFIEALQQAGVLIYKNDYPGLYDFLRIFKLNARRDLEDDVSAFSIRIFDEFCNEVLEKYNFDLHSSKRLYQNMLIHIEYMLRRMKSDFELKNPILSEVKKKYPFAYEISTLLVHIIYKYNGKYIQDDELSYIAIYIEHFIENLNKKLHVVLIGSSRRSVVHIVQDWLHDYYDKQLEVIELSSQSQLDEYCRTNTVDFIITLSDHIAHPKLPIYRISSFPEESDQKQIDSMIHKIKMNQRFHRLLEQYFSEDLMLIHEDCITFEEAIQCASECLFRQGFIDDTKTFYEDILLREVNYPTVVNERMMIPHPLATFAKKTAICVSLLRHPFTHNGVEIIFTLAIERKQNEDVNVLFDFLKQLASRKDALDALHECKSEKELLSLLFELSAKI